MSSSKADRVCCLFIHCYVSKAAESWEAFFFFFIKAEILEQKKKSGEQLHDHTTLNIRYIFFTVQITNLTGQVCFSLPGKSPKWKCRNVKNNFWQIFILTIFLRSNSVIFQTGKYKKFIIKMQWKHCFHIRHTHHDLTKVVTWPTHCKQDGMRLNLFKISN